MNSDDRDDTFSTLGLQAWRVLKDVAKTRRGEGARQRTTAEHDRGRPVEGPWTQRKPKIMRRKL